MSCISSFLAIITPPITFEKAKEIHEGLAIGQMIPVIGILPAVVQIIFSLGQLLASPMSSVEKKHWEWAYMGLLIAITNLITLGFAVPLFLLYEGYYRELYDKYCANKDLFFARENKPALVSVRTFSNTTL